MDILDPAAPQNPVSLPVDIANAILQYLIHEPDENKDTLQNCALACNHFRYQVRTYQFRSITISVQAEVKEDMMADVAQQIAGLYCLLVEDAYSVDSGYSLQSVVRSFFINVHITVLQRYGTAFIPNKLQWQTLICGILSKLSCLQKFGLAAIVQSPSISIIPAPWHLFPMAFRSSVIALLQSPSLNSVYLDGVEAFPVSFIPVGRLSHLGLRQVFAGRINVPNISSPSSQLETLTGDRKGENKLHSLNLADSMYFLQYLSDRFSLSMASVRSLSLDLTLSQRQLGVPNRYSNLLRRCRSIQSLEFTNKVSRGHAPCHKLNIDVDLQTFKKLKKLSFSWILAISQEGPTGGIPWDAMNVLQHTKGPTAIEHVVIAMTIYCPALSVPPLALSAQNWANIDQFLTGPCFPHLSKVSIVINVSAYGYHQINQDGVEGDDNFESWLSQLKRGLDADFQHAFHLTRRLVTVAFEVELKVLEELVLKSCALNAPQTNELAQDW